MVEEPTGANGAAELPTNEPAADGTGEEATGETDTGEAEAAVDDQCDSANEECEDELELVTIDDPAGASNSAETQTIQPPSTTQTTTQVSEVPE